MKLAGLIAAASLLLAMATAPASADNSWNGTWIGNWKNGNGTQIVFAGNTFISIYWDGDYVGDAEAKGEGTRVVTITWAGASAVVTRDGEAAAHVIIREKGKPDVSFPLKRDND